MTDTKIISWVSYPSSGSRRVYFVTLNEHVLGDSRGYGSVDEVQAACFAAVDRAGYTDGLRNAVYRPGYHRYN